MCEALGKLTGKIRQSGRLRRALAQELLRFAVSDIAGLAVKRDAIGFIRLAAAHR
ncbi:protein of unknown function [Serratia sp. Tan611]|nr:protein of unknown function [Serratia sp. Tan611]